MQAYCHALEEVTSKPQILWNTRRDIYFDTSDRTNPQRISLSTSQYQSVTEYQYYNRKTDDNQVGQLCKWERKWTRDNMYDSMGNRNEDGSVIDEFGKPVAKPPAEDVVYLEYQKP